MKRNTLYLFLIVLLSSAIGFLVGSQYLHPEAKLNFTHPSIQKLNRLMTYLTEDYVEEINTDSLVRVVIEDIVGALDPHSVYIPAQQRQALSESMRGNFEGIGVQFFKLKDTIAVVRVLEGGPSKKAGLQSGDRILLADQDTLFGKEKTNQEIISRLKGPSGTPVQLTVYRKAEDSLYTFNIARGPVPLPSVSSAYMLKEGIGYIKINRFSQTTYSEFEKSLKKLVDQELEDLILDLRGNPGGYLLPAKQILDDFLTAGKPIVIVEGNNGKRERTIASANGLFEQGGLCVLVDEDSASASEVIAGAIQDNDRGWIIGRRTFGKGLVQQQMPLGEGDQIRLTTARYFTPTGRSIQRPYDSTSREDYYAEVRARYESGEMVDPEKIHTNDSLAFTTPMGRKVYGGGGITPDFYISNESTPEEMWNQYLMYSNEVDRFVFLELDKNPNQYIFNSAAQLYNEELPYKETFITAFKKYFKERNIPYQVKNEEDLVNPIKAFIAIQRFDENLYTRIVNEGDPFIQKALSQINSD
jgi:carboxyl-terminal processing protease